MECVWGWREGGREGSVLLVRKDGYLCPCRLATTCPYRDYSHDRMCRLIWMCRGMSDTMICKDWHEVLSVRNCRGLSTMYKDSFGDLIVNRLAEGVKLL